LPVLFAIAAIALALAVLVLNAPLESEVAALPAAAANAACSARSPHCPGRPRARAPISSAELQGFHMKPPEPQPNPSRRRATATSSPCASSAGHDREDAGRHRRAGSRSQAIAERLQGLSRKKAGGRRDDRSPHADDARAAGRAARAVAVVRHNRSTKYIISRQDDGTYDAEEKIYKVSPRIVRVEGDATLAGAERMGAGAPRRR